MEIKLTTKNMAYMAMFAAMQVVLEYAQNFMRCQKVVTVLFHLLQLFYVAIWWIGVTVWLFHLFV